jgi:hypothetical protein
VGDAEHDARGEKMTLYAAFPEAEHRGRLARARSALREAAPARWRARAPLLLHRL